MPNPNPDQSGLAPFTAPDTSGGTVPITGKIAPDDKAWIQSLPDGGSFHIRQAVRLYRVWMNRKAGDWEGFEKTCKKAGLIP